MFHSAGSESSACAGRSHGKFEAGFWARRGESGGMKTIIRAWVLLVAVAAALPMVAAENRLTAEEKGAGWRLLFDGASLDGWRGYKQEAPGAGWRVENGALVLEGKAGDLVTKDAFGDFEFSFEWKVAEAANSGVIYRVALGEAATHVTGPEYQVLDNIKAKDNKEHDHLAASLYDIALGANARPKAVGEWNAGRVVVRGWHIEHWLNGEKVVDLDLATSDGKAAIAASKFKDWEKFATARRGHIALQDHGDVVSYRAVKVRELK